MSNLEIINSEKLNKPIVLFTSKVLEKIRYIVDKESEEIGFIGSVEELGDNKYLITNLYIPEQDRHGATCELRPEGLNSVTSEILKNNNLSRDEKLKQINSLRFWGHSHNTMGVTPSSKDVETARSFSNKGYLIAAIFNKSRDINLEFWDFNNNLLWKELNSNTKFNLTTAECEAIDEAIKTKVHEKSEITPYKSKYTYDYTDYYGKGFYDYSYSGIGKAKSVKQTSSTIITPFNKNNPINYAIPRK